MTNVVASTAMLVHYFPNPHHDDVTPKTLNEFLKTNNAYSIAGDFLDKNAVNRYSSFQVVYDPSHSTDLSDQFSTIHDLISRGMPVISKEVSGRGGINAEHFVVIDNALANSYFGVKDPYWYNTKNLHSGVTNSNNFIRNYEGHSDGLRVFALGTGAPDLAYSVINIGSPAELLITDPTGRRLGKDPTSDTTYNEIPGGTYFIETTDNATDDNNDRASDHKVAYLPSPTSGKYDIQVIGTDAGSYSLDVVNADMQGSTHPQIFFGNTQQNLFTSYDLDMNPQNSANSEVVPMDVTPPAISHTQLVGQYTLNSSPIQFNFGATDAGEGVYDVTAMLDGRLIMNGAAITFNKIGQHMVTINAEDFVGNKKTEAVIYNVVYSFSGFLPPIKIDGAGVYKLGQTLPVKFQLKDANNNFVASATAYLNLTKIQDGVSGTETVALSTSKADTGNVFRYDLINNQYIFNLNTSSLSPGTWQLRVDLGDGAQNTVIISFRK